MVSGKISWTKIYSRTRQWNGFGVEQRTFIGQSIAVNSFFVWYSVVLTESQPAGSLLLPTHTLRSVNRQRQGIDVSCLPLGIWFGGGGRLASRDRVSRFSREKVSDPHLKLNSRNATVFLLGSRVRLTASTDSSSATRDKSREPSLSWPWYNSLSLSTFTSSYYSFFALRLQVIGQKINMVKTHCIGYVGYKVI